MTIRERAAAGVPLSALWFGFVGPALTDAIHRQTLEGPPPVSLQNIRSRLQEDTGHVDEELSAGLAQLAAMELAEEERVMALLSVLDDTTQREAAARVSRLPPLVHTVDPRFFEPVTPSIIRAAVEQYGYAVSPLPFAPSLSRPHDLDHRDVLMQVLSAVHHRLLSEDQAAQVLQGAIELLDHHQSRQVFEAELRRTVMTP